MEKNCDSNKANKMKKYLRNKFDFFGIQTPLRKQIMKEFIKLNGLLSDDNLETICLELNKFPEREYHFAALDLLEKKYKKLGPDVVVLYEKLAVTNSWWDTVDLIATRFVSYTFLEYPKTRAKYIEKWRQCDNFWLRRITLLFQLKYKKETDTALLLELVNENDLSSKFGKEFFIQKAIGWVLREYAKTDSTFVLDLIQHSNLSKLSKREATKYL